MFTSFHIFKEQIRRYKGKDLCVYPYRYFFRWRRSLHGDTSSIKDEQPWITFETITFLNSNINSAHRIFEYGGGGSTLFLIKRAKEVVTVEHDREWFDKLQIIISEKKNNAWKGYFVAPEKGNLAVDPDPAIPAHYASDDLASKGFNFKTYASFIDDFPDAYFDCVIVDGRSRPSCMAHALPKIKANGFLIVDNSDREYYFKHTHRMLEGCFEKIMDHYGPCPYLTDFTKTAVWKKTRDAKIIKHPA